jgi:acyl-CoA synthetase (AMP-forming)/AMP-acid ligase II
VPDLLHDVLAHGERTPDAIALIDARGRQITYRTLAHRVLTTAGGLRASGLAPGDGVLFSIRPGPDALVLALAVVAAGGMIVFADPGVGADLFAARAELAAARWSAAESLLYAAGGVRLARGYARRRGLLLPDFAALPVRHIYSGRWLPGVPGGALPLRRVTAAPPPDLSPDLDAPAVVIFTSGTTARPRGVVHTLRSLSAGLGLLRQRCVLGPGDIVHTDQLMLGLPALAGGACWSLPGTPVDPARYARQLVERKVTHAFLVPGDAARVVDHAPHWPGVRGVLLGAAPVVPALLRRIRTAAPDAEILSIYGMTEAAPLAFATAEEKLAHTGTGDLLGTPADGVTVRTIDDELVVTGPHLAPRYLGESPLTELHTGDLGRIDGDGRLVMLGRRKDMIIRGEHNIYPGLYEPRIAGLPGVLDALLIGIPHEQTGDEEVVLAVVLAPGTSLSSVRQRLPDVVPGSAFPERVVEIAEVPRAGRTRKPDREALRCALR